MFDLIVRDAIIVNGGQEPFPGSVAITGEKIAAILMPDTDLPAARVIDAGGKILFPGGIDPHVHYRYDRGYDDGERDYHTETGAALLGGLTTAIRMHRELGAYREHIPVELKRLAAGGCMDMAFHLAIMTEDQLMTFPEAAREFGISSFKLYIAYKGKAGKLQGLQGADDGFLYDAMGRIGRYPDGIACVHCENSEVAERLGDALQRAGRNDLSAWTESRPGWAEGEAIHRAGYIAHHAGCPLYVVHVSSAEGVEAVENLRARGIALHAEVCIHHLTMTIAEAEPRLGGLAKVNPPLRAPRDVDALWDAIRRGVIDTVGSDHVPHTRAKLKLSLWDVMPGFAGSGTLLPALLEYGYHQRGIPLSRIATLVSGNAARIFGLKGKGEIMVGADADLTLIDLEAEREVQASRLLSAADYSLLDGRSLRGWPMLTILRGQVAMTDGVIQVPPGYGQFLRRPAG
jgi:dihydroorotase (multifunctional complex type)